MKRTVLTVILAAGFVAFSQKPPTSSYIDVDGNKRSFLSKEEVSIDDYCFFLYMTGQKYGKDSKQYEFLIPDTAKFRLWYGFPFSFFYGSSYETVKLQETLPMVAISYEQAAAYCQWVEFMLNQYPKHKYTWQCNLPEKADYEKALHSKKTKITQKESLSPLQIKCNEFCRKTKDGTECITNCRDGNYLFGITDNVAEYTQDGVVIEGGKNTMLKFTDAKNSENPIGFRIKATVVPKNKN